MDTETLLLVTTAFFIYYAFTIPSTLFYYSTIQSIPKAHQKINPSMIWINLLPLFGVIHFFTYTIVSRIADSFVSFYEHVGDSSIAAKSKSYATAYGVSLLLSTIPLLGCYLFLPAFGVWVMMILKFHQLSKDVQVTRIVPSRDFAY